MPKPQHIHEVYIRTTPERLWQALTDPELTKGYYYGCAVGSTWEPGAAYAYVGEMGPAITGEILEADPPRRLVMTFTMAYDPEAAAEHPSRVDLGDHAGRRRVPADGRPLRLRRTVQDVGDHADRLDPDPLRV